MKQLKTGRVNLAKIVAGRVLLNTDRPCSCQLQTTNNKIQLNLLLSNHFQKI